MQLLEGENPWTEDGDDARHWHDIYARLIEFTLRRMADQGGDRVLNARIEHYGQRHDFWLRRAWHLENLRIDEEARSIFHNSTCVRFTFREFQVVKVLLASPGQAFSSRRLLDQAWHDSALPEEAVRVYIGRIRRKLLTVDLAVILTDPRDGYRLEFTTETRGPSGATQAAPAAVLVEALA